MSIIRPRCVRTAMVAVTFNPTWTIPASIVTKELLPKSKRDRSYLAKNDIVFTPGRGWQQCRARRIRSASIKFETPNRFDVYLHDTPSRVAFDRFFRAQSHGCVRLEHAAELAGFVLRDLGWDETADRRSGCRERQEPAIDLKRPLARLDPLCDELRRRGRHGRVPRRSLRPRRAAQGRARRDPRGGAPGQPLD